MTPLPPAPTFNRESVVPATTDGPAVATHPLSGAAAGSPIPPGYVLVERELLGSLLKRVRRLQALERDELQRLPRDVPAFLRSPPPTFHDIRTRA